MTPVVFYVPWSIHTIFMYLTTDLENGAFALPTPLWWAKTTNPKSSEKHQILNHSFLGEGYRSISRTRLAFALRWSYISSFFGMSWWSARVSYRLHLDAIWLEWPRADRSNAVYSPSIKRLALKSIEVWCWTKSPNSLNCIQPLSSYVHILRRAFHICDQ